MKYEQFHFIGFKGLCPFYFSLTPTFIIEPVNLTFLLEGFLLCPQNNKKYDKINLRNNEQNGKGDTYGTIQKVFLCDTFNNNDFY